MCHVRPALHDLRDWNITQFLKIRTLHVKVVGTHKRCSWNRLTASADCMTFAWSTHPSRGLMIKHGQSEVVDEMGRVYDALPMSAPSPGGGRATSTREHQHQQHLALRHNQDVVVDTAGTAYNVRVHLTQHLQTNQRMEKLEATVVGELSTQRTAVLDIISHIYRRRRTVV